MGWESGWRRHFFVSCCAVMCCCAVLCSAAQAAGVVPVAHNSGGPRDDIVTPGVTGYLATEPDEYADAFAHVLNAKVRHGRRAAGAELISVCGAARRATSLVDGA